MRKTPLPSSSYSRGAGRLQTLTLASAFCLSMVTEAMSHLGCVSGLLVLVAAVLSAPGLVGGQEVCSSRGLEWKPAARVRFGLIVSLRKADRMGCGIISEEALQLYIATQWVLEKLNKDNGSYIPGVQFGE